MTAKGFRAVLGLQPLVVNKRDYGHCIVANNRKLVKNCSSNFEVEIWRFRVHIF